MAAHGVKGFSLFRDKKAIDSAIPYLMDLAAESMANFFFELIINPTGYLHRLSVLLPICQPLPSNQATNPHDGARQRPACFPSPRHPTGQSTSSFEDLFASHI